MNQQQEARRAAAQAFKESLDSLQETLGTADTPESSPPTHSAAAKAREQAAKIDLKMWEEAIADIDQFIQSKEKLAGHG